MAETNEVTYDIRVSRARLPADLAAAEREIVAAARASAQKAREQVRRLPMRFGVDEQATRNELARVLRNVREEVKRQRVEVQLGLRYNRADLNALERARFAATGPAPVAATSGGGAASFARTGAIVVGGAIAAAQLSGVIARALENVRGIRSSDRLESLESRQALGDTARSIPLFGLAIGPLRDFIGSVTGLDKELKDAIQKQRNYNAALESTTATLRGSATAAVLGRQTTALGELAIRQQNELGSFDAETTKLVAGVAPDAAARLQLQRQAARDQILVRQQEERTRAIEDARNAEAATRTTAAEQAERNLLTFEARVGRQTEAERNNPLIQEGNRLQRQILRKALDTARNQEAIQQSASLQQARDEQAKQKAEEAQRRVAAERERAIEAERRAARAAQEYARRLEEQADQAGRQFDLRRRLESIEADSVRRTLFADSAAFAATDLRFINAERGATPEQQRKVEQSLNTLNQLTREQVGLIRQIAQAGVNLAILGP